MGELVTHLERCGYVERRPDPADGRARLVVATAAGGTALAVAGECLRRIEAAISAELGGAALAEVRAALARIPAAIAVRPVEPVTRVLT